MNSFLVFNIDMWSNWRSARLHSDTMTTPANRNDDDDDDDDDYLYNQVIYIYTWPTDP